MLQHNEERIAGVDAAADDVADTMITMIKIMVNEDDGDEYQTRKSMMERLEGWINVHNAHVTEIILMCLASGAEEDKKHDNVTLNYPCSYEREHHTPFTSHRTEVYQYR